MRVYEFVALLGMIYSNEKDQYANEHRDRLGKTARG